MKSRTSLVILSALVSPLVAQPPVVVAPPVVVEKQVTETVTPGQRVVEETVVQKPSIVVPGGYDPRARLGIVPRAIPLEGAPVNPGTTVETTETTHSAGGRVYNTERNVVIVEGRELPYATIPVLFIKETAELLDSESRAALEQTAAAITDVVRVDPTALFDIEGHTSTDGTDAMNMQLSAARAQRIYDELTQRYGVPRAVLSAHGYGENYPAYPNGSESQMMLDRRVLVVRVK